MSSFSERVSALSSCILNDKLWEGLKAPLPEGSEPSAALLKKLESAELEAKRLVPVMPELTNRYLEFEKIENDPRFLTANPEKEKQLFRSHNSLKKKFAKFEWDKEKQEFIKGRPNNGDMNSINLGPLLEAWNKFLGGGEPVTATAVAGSPPEFTDSEIPMAEWESFKIRIGKRFEAHLQFILSKPDLADKLKQIQSILQAVDPTREEPVNVEELSKLANEIVPHLEGPALKGPKTCTEKGCKSKAVRGDHCRDCSTQYWTEGPIIKDLRIREAEYKRRVGDQEFLNYKHEYRNDFDEVVTKYEKHDGDKGYAELVTLYKKMDKILPKMGTFQVSPLETERMSSSKRKKREESYEELSSDPMEESDEEEEDDEDEDDEEDDEDEEEEEEEEEDYRPKKNKKKRQAEPSLDDVLALFAPRDPLIAELHQADDLKRAWKRVKDELTKTYRVEFMERNTGETARQWKLLLREAKVFDSREKAEAFATGWVGSFPEETYSYQIIEE